MPNVGSFASATRRWNQLTGAPGSFPSRCASCGFLLLPHHKVSVRERRELVPLAMHLDCAKKGEPMTKQENRSSEHHCAHCCPQSTCPCPLGGQR